MLQDKINLTAKEILEKEFKSGMRGYKPEDVDKFLDMIIKDYETFYNEYDLLVQENARLKRQVEEAGKKPQQTNSNSGSTNFDILRRLSNLEKHVFGSKLYD
ncbi:cell division regulator GpsB [Sutcliffiella rhizosphaerae]|uniref:Cell cycle protein GpsB n=1 Tax=Sutcliffiella rhizosphaerae TaxID=2880967 RepID=A0ABM8YRL3_9BACI|nr:cell division regulator GpsB [Sutcliffiella rhizosphaerae]CAG9622598.1 Cell cycle protein GpsB [Sutcliffiella rhizosphaerae]